MENKINEMGEEGVGSVCLMSMGIPLWGKKPQPTLVMSQQHQTNRQKTSGDRLKVGYLDKWLPQHTW